MTLDDLEQAALKRKKLRDLEAWMREKLFPGAVVEASVPGTRVSCDGVEVDIDHRAHMGVFDYTYEEALSKPEHIMSGADMAQAMSIAVAQAVAAKKGKK